jgi:hypothetical protein
MSPIETKYAGAVALVAALAAGTAQAAPVGATAPPGAEPSLLQAIAAGSILIDLRPRYEGVDQAGIAKRADAYTLRTQLGWRTAPWHDLTAELGFENVAVLGGQHYNSTINGKTQYPVIGDPPTTELHVAQIGWTPDPNISAVVGRQRINLDDQRFIGTANWRQDEQSFDAARLDARLGRFSLTYVYLERINRVYAQALNWNSDSHALNAYYTLGQPLRLEGFYYAFDFRQAPANSSLTYGGRLSGQLQLPPLRLSYAATYGRQEPYGNNPAQFGLNYWHGELTGGWSMFSVKADYEVLGGDGAHGFSTPLATLHIFQGWADVFLTTPAKGIRDANLSLDIRPPFALQHLANPEFFVRYNDFEADTDGSSLGHEWDVMATAQIAPHLTGLVKFADYRGPVLGPASRTKVWVGCEFRM